MPELHFPCLQKGVSANWEQTLGICISETVTSQTWLAAVFTSTYCCSEDGRTGRTAGTCLACGTLTSGTRKKASQESGWRKSASSSPREWWLMRTQRSGASKAMRGAWADAGFPTSGHRGSCVCSDAGELKVIYQGSQMTNDKIIIPLNSFFLQK